MRMDRLQALLHRCRAGDAEAMEELVRRWERKLFYYVRRLVAQEDDAWDVLQQTWARIVPAVGKVRDADKLVPWMYRVARNAALTHWKSLLARERWVDAEAAVEEVARAEAIEPRW